MWNLLFGRSSFMQGWDQADERAQLEHKKLKTETRAAKARELRELQGDIDALRAKLDAEQRMLLRVSKKTARLRRLDAELEAEASVLLKKRGLRNLKQEGKTPTTSPPVAVSTAPMGLSAVPDAEEEGFTDDLVSD